MSTNSLNLLRGRIEALESKAALLEKKLLAVGNLIDSAITYDRSPEFILIGIADILTAKKTSNAEPNEH